jgi:hypothetical protein
MLGIQRKSDSSSLMGEELDVVGEGRMSCCCFTWRNVPSFVL